jgi:hypothetical protein
MSRAPTKAFTPADFAACPAESSSIAKATRPTQASIKQRPINKVLIRIITPSFYSILQAPIVLDCCDSKQGEFNRERSSLAIKGRAARVEKNDLTLYLRARFILTMLKGLGEMKVGELAEATGVSVQAIRFY